MRIALDATYSIGPDLTGVGVYSAEILHSLAAAHPGQEFLHCYRPHRFLRALAKRGPRNCRRRPLWEDRPAAADLFHGLNQRLPRARYRYAAATFHDLFVLTAQYSTTEFRERFARQAREAAARADLIVAVSRFTAEQVKALLKVDEARIRVIPHGVRPPPPSASAPAREPLILSVGAIQKRKNIPRLVRAFERLAPGWRLALAGSAGFGAAEILGNIEASPRRRDIDVLGYVPAADLESLYARASIFAFPSLDEGFGMPVLDAMARGLPVVTSSRSALPEVAGDAALLVDPTDEDAIAGALMRLIDDETLRSGLSRRGHERALEFSWEQAAAQTWAAYGALMASAGRQS
ncbi:MAG: glycosyltransferase family 4 protein [Bryobacteraceae bacterium]|nr:glycosyltransferase family 4 protein [Bryobacteraceae bacterium]